ncbi:TPA: oxygen-sensing cyclic-di-GMP phosphodiesterase DosP [Pseudomonas aeruginosa]
MGDALIAALEQSLFACVVIDEQDRVQLFNQAAEQLWGYSRSEVLGLSVTRLVPPALREHHGSFIQRNREGGKPVVVGMSRDLQLVRKSGETVWTSFSLLKLQVSGGVHYLAFARDVSDEVALSEQLTLLQKAFDCSQQPMLVLNAQRRVVRINRAFTALFGYQSDEILGQDPAEVLTSVELTAEEMDIHRSFPWGDEPVLQDTKARCKNGRSIWIRIWSSPIDRVDGAFERYSLDVLHDITEERRLRDLERDVLQALTSSVGFSELGSFLCQRVQEIAPDIMPSIVLVDESQQIRPWAAAGLAAEYISAIDGLAVGPHVGSCGAAAARAAPWICRDIEHDPNWAEYAGLALRHGLRACWSFPIKLRSGMVAGAFAFYARTPSEPSAFHLRIVEACIHLCMLGIEREQARVQMERLTYFDRLTGLMNGSRVRLYIDELLAKDRVPRIAILSLGLDSFRDINEAMGHDVGDQVLLEVAVRLQESVNQSAIVSRTEGDSFVVVAPGYDINAAAQLARRLQASVATPLDVNGHRLQLSASVGISLYPDAGTVQDSLLEDAKRAMYEAKVLGKGIYRFFSVEMNERARERVLLGAALRHAISDDALRLVYQPQVRLVDRTLYGVEALARWHDPRFGNIPPDRFVELAEEIGEIENLGRWALREACRQMSLWRQQCVPVPVVSVNLSPMSFRDPGLTDYLSGLLGEYRLPGECLTIEITESASMTLTDRMRRMIGDIRTLGIGLAVDDFGTGYSSLSNLTNLPVTELKIDRSFIDQCPRDDRLKSLVDALIGLGASLGMTVVAEGAETAEQHERLRLRGCPVIQGYFFARPMEPERIPAWIEGRLDSANA